MWDWRPAENTHRLGCASAAFSPLLRISSGVIARLVGHSRRHIQAMELTQGRRRSASGGEGRGVFARIPLQHVPLATRGRRWLRRLGVQAGDPLPPLQARARQSGEQCVRRHAQGMHRSGRIRWPMRSERNGRASLPLSRLSPGPLCLCVSCSRPPRHAGCTGSRQNPSPERPPLGAKTPFLARSLHSAARRR